MSHTEDGEFELVLGNRQLLSVFFIVVVLLGVFFVMGYILGKNATPAPAMDIASARKASDAGPPVAPLVVDRTVEKPSPAPEPRLPEPKLPEPKLPETKTVERKVAVEPPAKVEPKKEIAKATPPPAPTPVPVTPPSGAGKAGDPPKGSLFLQVAAVGRAEGDVVAKVLRGKGFDVWVAPTDKENMFRVLVGPLQRPDLGKTRGQLTELGFSPFPRSF